MKKHLFQTAVFTLLLVTVILCGVLVTSAEDLHWQPAMGETNADYRVTTNNFSTKTDADGTYLYNQDTAKGASMYVYDEKGQLGTYDTFSMGGDFYFGSFPTGLRDGQYTPEQKPVSFLCWWLKRGDADVFNALRLDGDGYLHTNSDGSAKTDIKFETGNWYNVQLVVTPKNGLCDLFIDGEKRLTFSIGKFYPEIHRSNAVRFFDGYYSWSFKMKNVFVKTDSAYKVELPREASADFISYQTTKPDSGKFDMRLLAGINGLKYRNFGYQVLVLNKNAAGEVVYEELTGTDTKVYSAIYGGTKSYNVKENFGYDYACLATIRGLDATADRTELVVRPYTISEDGSKKYGVATVLVYDGEADSQGYPVLREENTVIDPIITTDDTYVYNGDAAEDAGNYGTNSYIFVRNTGTENSNLYRAAYFQFTLSAEEVAKLDKAVSAKLSLPLRSYEEDPTRKVYDMLLHATATGWDELELTFNNRNTLAPVGELIYRHEGVVSGLLEVDILDHLKKQPKNADGSITVSFRLTNEGASDAKVTTWYTKEATNKPSIKISVNWYDNVLRMDKLANVGYEPWGYAEELVDEWFSDLRDKVYPKDEDGNLIYYDDVKYPSEGYGATTATGDFQRKLVWKNGNRWSTKENQNYHIADTEWRADRYARTIATLGTSKGKAFLNTSYGQTVSEYDRYGGISNAGFTGEATGFFHTEKIGGRTYIIDPLGNPYFAAGMNTVDLGATTDHSNFVLAKFETEQAYFDAISASLKGMGINSVFATNNMAPLLAAPEEDRLSVVPWLIGVSSYMSSIGCSQVSEGVFPNNNTIAVFDPDFKAHVYKKNPEKITEMGWADNPNILAYIADNELPSGDDILTRYLTVDVAGDPVNAFSYATAWTFLARWMDTPMPSLEEYMASPDCAAMNSEFLSFVYARQYGVIRESIERVDKNHMYIGSRVNGTCRTNEGYLRAAGYYLDVISTNLYDGLNPSAETIYNLYRYSGKPFIVTEFFAKGVDAIDSNGYIMANSTGAGILATTQEDRGAYYEHYVMTLLESKACVGWVWYRFRDNDQPVYQSTTNGSENPLIMLYVTYGANPKAHTFMDTVTGEILTAAEVGTYKTIDAGESMASNHNVNKGIYNSDFSSVVMIYTYDASGKIIAFEGHEVQTPASETPADGTVLKAAVGDATYTIGTGKDASGNTTKTVLTVYEGKYLALAASYKNLSDHIIGLVKYFDAQ